MVLLVGRPGAGKSAFCQQAALLSLVVDRPIIYVTTKYGSSDAERALKERGLQEVEPGVLSFVDAYNETVGVSVSDRPDTVYANCNNLSSIDIAISRLREKIGRRDILLIFDSLTSPYLFSGSEILRFMTQTLSRFAAEGNSVLTCIDEGCGRPEDLVAMMSLSDGVIKMETEEGKRVLNIVKHPKVRPTRIEEPAIEPERWAQFDPSMIDVDWARRWMQAMMRGDEAAIRKEVGDFVNLFWTNLIHWSGMLWDPKRFPTMEYKLSKEDESYAHLSFKFFPWYARLSARFMPKNFSKVENMRKILKMREGGFRNERSGIVEYVEDISKTDEHYIRVYENCDCWGFENVGTAMALYLPSSIAGSLMSCEEFRKGPDRDWNAVETRCIGLGDPYCEFKVMPGEIHELKDSVEKDSAVLEKIHERMMQRLMGFLLDRKPLVERPKLGSDVHLHVVGHVIGWLSHALAGQRYEMALRMGGAKAGKEVGEHLVKAGISEDEATKRVFNFLEYCKVGKVMAGETMRIVENCESLYTTFLKIRHEAPSCYFTTGFLNGFFSAVNNQHVKETKCIAAGDPYCEWEFR
jgi:predicted hydrocarbon binding protein/KaiC/GvpD/RAD55 family RecA-like ATPase